MRPSPSPRTPIHARLAIGSALAAMLLAAGCGGSDPVAPPTPPAEIGTVSPTTGGTLAVPGGTAQLVFPAGAVATSTPITAQPIAAPAGDATVVPGTVYDFGPDGAQFAEPVQLTIAYDPARLPSGTAEGTLAIHKLFPDGWRLIPGGAVDVATNKATAPITTFSTYAVRPVSVREAAARAGDAQEGIAGAALPIAPSVLVRAPGGQPLVGVAVTFAVTTGGGSVQGASAVTDAEGVATAAAWVLGAEPGANALTATVQDGPTVSFAATGVAACAFAPAYALGTVAAGTLGETDCAEASGRRADYRTIVVAAETSVTLTMTAQGFTPLVGLTKADGTPLVTQYTASPGFTRAVLAAGSYRLTTRAVETTGAGTYTVTVAAAPNDANACEVAARVFLTVGSGNDGRLAETDCADEIGDPQDRVDSYSVWLTAGTTYRATLTGTPRAKLSVFGPSAATPGPMELAGGASSASVLFTATESGWHALYPLGRPGSTYRIGISTAQAIPPCEQAPSYTIGERVEGWLSAVDCVESSGRRADYRTLTVDEETSVTLTMEGGGYTPLVGITTPEGRAVVTQFVSSPGVTRAVLAPGTYRITTRGVDTTAAGWYSLVVAAGTFADDTCSAATNVFLSPGAGIDGTLTTGDCVDEVGDPTERVDAHSVWMMTGRSYRATIAAAPAAKLSLWGPNASGAALRDLASGPQAAEIVFTPTHEGWHTVYALGPVGTTYRIAVVEIPTVAACDYVRPYVLGSTVLGNIGDDDCVGSGDRRIDHYALTTTSQTSLTLTMGSDDLTSLVGVQDATGTAIATQFTTSPGFTRVILAPGSYRLTARATEAAMRGVYVFTAAEASHAADGCGGAFNVFVTPGVTASGQIGAADCADDYGDPTHRLDTYVVRMVAGTTYTMTLTTSGAQWVSLWAPSDSGTIDFVKAEATAAAGSATLTFTAVRTGLHYVYTGGTPGPSYQLAFAGSPAASPRRVRATSAAAGSAPVAAPRRTTAVRGSQMR